MRSFVFAAATALVLGACTPLTSDHPLFAVADQTGPAPLTEGVWVALNSRCTHELATTTPMPSECEPLTLSHAPDGGWVLSGSKVENGVEHREQLHLIVVPAVPTANPDAYAPLYIIQTPAREADPHSDADAETRVYAALAPIGTLPAREAFLVDLECESVLREGPIDGVTAEHDARGSISKCTAENQGAVREAARRATIEQLANIDDSRLVLVRP